MLRQIPAHLIAGVQSGELKVFGSVIRSELTNRIVGHLQETSGLSKMVGLAMAPVNPIGAAASAVELIGQGVTYSQNRAILNAVKTIEQLQIASLAVGVVGIGVSIAGTALVLERIKRVEAKVEKVMSELQNISSKLDALRLDRIAEDFTRLRTASAQLDEGWTLANPQPEWRSVARETHALADAFARRASDALADQMRDPFSAEPFIEGFVLASTIRSTARLAAGDEEAARDGAKAAAETAAALGQTFQLGRMVSRQMKDRPDAGTMEWTIAVDEIAKELRPSIESIREREWALASSVSTIDELMKQGIGGYAWLAEAREEQEHPLLFLPTQS